MSHIIKNDTGPDEWNCLKSFTEARIALGRTGVSVPLKESLRFKLAHAHARDAVYSVLDTDALVSELQKEHLECCIACSEAENREVYLQRPDLGRVLTEGSAVRLQKIASVPVDIALIMADGLSATAVNRNAAAVAIPFIRLAREHGLTIAPVVLAEQARVAIADEIGFILRAKLSVILIGERPGLSASDSLGAYITFNPQSGYTDERRNCISNIRKQGMKPSTAAGKILNLALRALKLKISGVHLKDNDGVLP